MLTELTQISVKTDPDILHLHQLALQVAGWAGLSSAEQICFAVNVSNNSFNTTSDGEQVTFSIYEKKAGHSFLKAEMRDKAYTVEKELPRSTNTNDLPVFQENIIVQKNEGERYRDMQQFTFALSHDLKNSLTKLKLALSLAAVEEMPAHINNYFQIIHRSADRLETMMLSLNKIIELGDASPDVVKTVSLSAVYDDLYDEFAESIQKNGAFINSDFSRAGELNYIEVYLKSIFSNLLSNAIKYSAPERPLYLSIIACRQDDYVSLTFADNGQGIDMQSFGNKLFLPFTRFSTKGEGSGVGLYLIKNIVERNGGNIVVESTLGEGTTFRLMLKEYPLAK